MGAFEKGSAWSRQKVVVLPPRHNSSSSAWSPERTGHPENQRDCGVAGPLPGHGVGWHRRQDSDSSRPGSVRHAKAFTAIIA